MVTLSPSLLNDPRLNGLSLAFIGDSIMRQHRETVICLLYALGASIEQIIDIRLPWDTYFPVSLTWKTPMTTRTTTRAIKTQPAATNTTTTSTMTIYHRACACCIKGVKGGQLHKGCESAAPRCKNTHRNGTHNPYDSKQRPLVVSSTRGRSKRKFTRGATATHRIQPHCVQLFQLR